MGSMVTVYEMLNKLPGPIQGFQQRLVGLPEAWLLAKRGSVDPAGRLRELREGFISIGQGLLQRPLKNLSLPNKALSGTCSISSPATIISSGSGLLLRRSRCHAR
jgi:hypothetical protein